MVKHHREAFELHENATGEEIVLHMEGEETQVQDPEWRRFEGI